MRIARTLQKPAYLALAALFALAFLILYAHLQLLGLWHTLDVWIAEFTPLSATLLAAFLALFGITVAYQVHLWREPKTCPPNARAKGAGISGAGTLGAFLVAQCPACAAAGVFFFLPAGAALALANYGWVLSLASIAVMLLALRYLGAFEK